MTMEAAGRGRFQFSVRSLVLLTALLAAALAPIVWVTRERQRMLRAREEAIRSVLLSERRRAEMRARTGQSGATNSGPDANIESTEVPDVPPEILIEHLRRENDELKDTVDSLREEVKRLRAANKR
jgi:hypothetical protein